MKKIFFLKISKDILDQKYNKTTYCWVYINQSEITFQSNQTKKPFGNKREGHR